MKNEVLSRSIVAIDLEGKVYTINEYTSGQNHRYALSDGNAVEQTTEHVFRIPETGVDLRAIY